MKQHYNFIKFDAIGNDIISKLITWKDFEVNPDQFGWWDSKGTGENGKKYLQEIKCNHSNQIFYDTTIITKHDFDLLLANTPDDVTPLYITILNNFTYIFNLRKVAADLDVFQVRNTINKASSMRANAFKINEDWVYIDRAKCKEKKYMKILEKGAMSVGYNLDKLLLIG